LSMAFVRARRRGKRSRSLLDLHVHLSNVERLVQAMHWTLWRLLVVVASAV
jgi:hypothetical protein